MQKLAVRLCFSYFAVALVSFSLSAALKDFLPGYLPFFFSALFFGSVIATVSALIFFMKTRKRLEKMSAFIDRIGRGDFDRPLASPADDELGRLETGLADTAASLRCIIGNLDDEKGQHEAVLASMGEGVVVTDLEGKVTLSNRKADEFFGRALTGQKVSEVTRDPKLLDLVERVRGSWHSASGEVTISGPKETILSVAVTPLIRNMRVLGAVIVFHDISILKKLETMRKDFVANVSHELKTPLTSIRGFAETLADGGLEDGENARKFVETIRRNAERLGRLVEDLLTLSNIELGKVTFDIRPIDLEDPVKSVVATLKQKADEKGLELNAELPETIKLKADKDRLEQILMNLVDNGIKFTDSGAVTISTKRLKGRVAVSVRDTGSGIPEKDLGRIGERFYRVDPARSRELGGTGLGLAIVKHLVASMGGDFSISSEINRGTSITCTFPSA